MDGEAPQTRPERRPPLTRAIEGKIDNRGRIAISADNARALGPTFVLTRTFSGVLAAYPEEEFYKIMDEADAQPMSLAKEEYLRLIYEDTDWNVKIDDQNRFVLPEHFRKLARLKEGAPVILFGCGRYLEIWSPDELERYKDDAEGYNAKRRKRMQELRQQMGLVA